MDGSVLEMVLAVIIDDFDPTSLNSIFNQNAAAEATHEDASRRLKVIKHYVRAIYGSKDINKAVKDVLINLGIDPEVPGSVVGGYDYVLAVLKLMHPRCRGAKCVLKLKRDLMAQQTKKQKQEERKKKKVLMKNKNDPESYQQLSRSKDIKRFGSNMINYI